MIGKRLRDLRKKLGYNQKNFADLLGITERTLRNYEKGNNLPSSLLTILIEKFNININWLLTGEGDMFLKDYTNFTEVKNAYNLPKIYPGKNLANPTPSTDTKQTSLPKIPNLENLVNPTPSTDEPHYYKLEILKILDREDPEKVKALAEFLKGWASVERSSSEKSSSEKTEKNLTKN